MNWEYLIEVWTEDGEQPEFQVWLNKFGKDGWDVASIGPVETYAKSPGTVSGRAVIFKRQYNPADRFFVIPSYQESHGFADPPPVKAVEVSTDEDPRPKMRTSAEGGLPADVRVIEK